MLRYKCNMTSHIYRERHIYIFAVCVVIIFWLWSLLAITPNLFSLGLVHVYSLYFIFAYWCRFHCLYFVFADIPYWRSLYSTPYYTPSWLVVATQQVPMVAYCQFLFQAAWSLLFATTSQCFQYSPEASASRPPGKPIWRRAVSAAAVRPWCIQTSSFHLWNGSYQINETIWYEPNVAFLHEAFIHFQPVLKHHNGLCFNSAESHFWRWWWRCRLACSSSQRPSC